MIHGLMETKTEGTDKNQMVLDVINTKLNIEISQLKTIKKGVSGKWKVKSQKPQAIKSFHNAKMGIMSLEIKNF